jgi:hypothetical protein
LPSQEIDYDGSFRLSRRTLGELGLLIFLLHQPGEHMCLRRIRKMLFLSAQGASNDRKGGMIVMKQRIIVHHNTYAPNVQLYGSTEKELLAIEEAIHLATNEYTTLGW